VEGPPIMKRLIEGIEHKARMGIPACSATDDASKGVNHKGHLRSTDGGGAADLRTGSRELNRKLS
jgi:hypothetical protein